MLDMVEKEDPDISMGEKVLVVMTMEMLFFHANWVVELRAQMSHMGMLLEAG